MVRDDFLQRDVPEYGGAREFPQARDVDEELPDRDPEGEGAIAPEEHIGLTPPD